MSSPDFSLRKHSTAKTIKGYACLVFAGVNALSPMNSSAEFGYSNTPTHLTQYQGISSERGLEQVYYDNTFDLMKIRNLNTIFSLSELQDDWNGNGAKPFGQSVISQFASIIQTLSKQPDIAPTGRSSLYMQYISEDKSMLAFEVTEKKVEEVLIPHGDFSLAKTNVFYDAFSENIENSVRHFYGQR